MRLSGNRVLALAFDLLLCGHALSASVAGAAVLDALPQIAAAPGSGQFVWPSASRRPELHDLTPAAAAPGVTIRIRGSDFNSDGGFIRVFFVVQDSRLGRTARLDAKILRGGTDELEVIIPTPPQGAKVAHVHVETVAGNSPARRLDYLPPRVREVRPAQGMRGQHIEILGENFGTRTALDVGTLVRFGGSIAFPVSPEAWQDQRIVVHPPSDFGLGTNRDIVLDLAGCGARYGLGGTAKVILDYTMPSCKDLREDMLRRLQLEIAPEFLSRPVPVVVQTAAGISPAARFTFVVPTESQTASASQATPQGVSLYPIRKLLPVDEAPRDPSLVAFRARLLQAVNARDANYLLSILHKDIRVSFGDDFGIRRFIETWTPHSPTSRIWQELGDVIRLGGRFDPKFRNLFTAPYVFGAEIDEEHGAIVGTSVPVRSGPALTSDTIATLSHDLVQYGPYLENSPTTTVSGAIYTWVRIKLHDGRIGYVLSRDIRGAYSHRAGFQKEAEEWRMVYFVKGD